MMTPTVKTAAKSQIEPLKPRRIFLGEGVLLIGDIVGGSFTHPTMTNIVPLTMVFFEEIKRFLDDHYEGCDCKLVGAFNRALGCNKAAEMHLDEGKMYQREDWCDHFHEEDVIELPLMMALGSLAASLGGDRALITYATRIHQEHERFRKQPSWDGADLAAHAGLEDQAMLRLLAVMKRCVLLQTNR
jgi:hypothetical protein